MKDQLHVSERSPEGNWLSIIQRCNEAVTSRRIVKPRIMTSIEVQGNGRRALRSLAAMPKWTAPFSSHAWEYCGKGHGSFRHGERYVPWLSHGSPWQGALLDQWICLRFWRPELQRGHIERSQSVSAGCREQISCPQVDPLLPHPTGTSIHSLRPSNIHDLFVAADNW